jgi:hypothetical protein
VQVFSASNMDLTATAPDLKAPLSVSLKDVENRVLWSITLDPGFRLGGVQDPAPQGSLNKCPNQMRWARATALVVSEELKMAKPRFNC